MTLSGLCHALYHPFKQLKLFSYQLNSKNNGPVLLFKSILRQRNCFLLSIATDGKD